MPPEEDEGDKLFKVSDIGIDSLLDPPRPVRAPSEEPAESPHAGHRERLRNRFMRAGQEALADHEMLEFLLFSAIPRRDTKPWAKKLIARFGSYEGAITAEPSQLREIFPKNDSAIAILKAVEAAAIRLTARQVMGKPIIASWNALINYCQANIARYPIEQFRVLLLDKKNRLIDDCLMGEGTVDHAPVYPREIMKRVIAANASAVILVHNHPSGDPTPSRADIDMTKTIVQALKTVHVSVHDHLVIGRTGHVSFVQAGYL